MAVYEEQFEQHPSHEMLGQLEVALSQALKETLEGAAADHIDRLLQVVSFVRKRLEIASPVLNSAARLNGLSTSLQNALKEVNQFVANGNVAHLANASNHIDGSVTIAASLATLPGGEPSISAADAVSFKKAAEQVIKQLQKQAVATKESQDQLSNNAAELAKKLEGVKGQLESIQSTASSKLEEIQNAYNAEETNRRTEFGKTEEKRAQQFTKRIDELDEASEETIRTLNQKRQEAERIVRLIGNVGLTGNYKGALAEEKKAADRLRSQALWCFLGAFAVMAGTLVLTAIEGFHPWLTLFRMGAALFLLIPGAYAAKESSRHRTNENRHRRSELELATIDAYIESLPEGKRHEIKAELTSKFFGQDPEPEHQSEPAVTGNALVSLLKDAIAALSKQ